MGEIIPLRPDAEIENQRWVPKLVDGGFAWIVADTFHPGDFYGFFRTRSAAAIEARRRNAPQPEHDGDDIPW